MNDPNPSNKLKIFICHASENRGLALELFYQLQNWGFEPWIDQEDLLVGDKWDTKIRKEIENTDIFIVCLSQTAIQKKGYYQKEIAIALEVAKTFPDNLTFIFPVKFEDCDLPDRLSEYHCIDLFTENDFGNLLRSLNKQASLRNKQPGSENKLIIGKNPNESQRIPDIRELPELKFYISSDMSDTGLLEKDIQNNLKSKYRVVFINRNSEQNEDLSVSIADATYFIGIYQDGFIGRPNSEYKIAQIVKSKNRILIFAHAKVITKILSILPEISLTLTYTPLVDVPKILTKLVSN